MSAESEDKALWGILKERTRKAIDGEDDHLLYELREYFDHAYQEAIALHRARDKRRYSGASAERERECREIQERAIDEILT